MKRALLKILIISSFIILFTLIAVILNNPNPTEFVFHTFAIIGMLHWIDEKLLKKEPND